MAGFIIFFTPKPTKQTIRLFLTYEKNCDTHCSKISFYAPKIEDRGHIVFALSVILKFLDSVILSSCKFTWNVNLANNLFWVLDISLGNNFSTVSARVFIFYMNIPCDKLFELVHCTNKVNVSIKLYHFITIPLPHRTKLVTLNILIQYIVIELK